MRTVLLDLDGTLVDSASVIMEHLAGAFRANGLPVPATAALRRMLGPPLETALPGLGLSDAQATAVMTAYRTSYRVEVAATSPPFPGIPAVLSRLAGQGMRLALATAKPEHLADGIVRALGLDRHLTLVGGADHGAGRIGKAMVVGSVLDRLGLDPRTHPVVMVGDRSHDVDGAAEHGVPTVGVTWGYAEPGELDGASRLVRTPAELPAVLAADAVWSAA